MLLVNNPGTWSHVHPPLAHAQWDGWTFTDLVFPFFLFIGGVAMTLSLGRAAAAGADRGELLRKLSVRALLIFAIGIALHLFPSFDFESVRIPGVLQRIALCTLAAAPLVIWCNWRQQLSAVLALFTLYTVPMRLVPVPGADGVVRAGALEPGQDFGAWLDRLLLGGHLWSQSKTWDPEGLLSTLPAIGSTLLGALAGRLLALPLSRAEHAAWCFVAGAAALLLGLLLDALLMPINKSLWTPSYAVFMTGWALLFLGSFYWLLDGQPSAAWRARAVWWSRPLLIFGMNALFLFALSSLIAKLGYTIRLTQADGGSITLQKWLFAPLQALPLAPVNASLLHALLFVAGMFLIAWAMWRRRWFVKV